MKTMWSLFNFVCAFSARKNPFYLGLIAFERILQRLPKLFENENGGYYCICSYRQSEARLFGIIVAIRILDAQKISQNTFRSEGY